VTVWGAGERAEAAETSALSVSDAELVRQARQGDAAAFHALVDRHAQPLYRLARSMLGPGGEADADDVVQETFMGALKRLDAFEGRAAPGTWLRRILVNQVSKVYRSRGVRRALSLDANPPGGGGGDDADGPGRGVTPAAGGAGVAEDVERRADVQAMLDSLSPDHRQVLVLRELDGLSYDEIADVLKVPRGTVESRIFRARQQIKEKFAGYLEGERGGAGAVHK
jgi:RNA polymerase sigma-70 factor (ECF subfamily)